MIIVAAVRVDPTLSGWWRQAVRPVCAACRLPPLSPVVVRCYRCGFLRVVLLCGGRQCAGLSVFQRAFIIMAHEGLSLASTGRLLEQVPSAVFE